MHSSVVVEQKKINEAAKPASLKSCTDTACKQATLVAVVVTTFMLPLDYTVVAVALRDIQRDLQADFTDLQWTVNAYTLTFAAFLMTGGALADLFGRRRMFVIGTILFAAASLTCGLAQFPLMLNLSRGVQGIGAATMFSASLAILVQQFQGAERARVFGIYGAVVGAGAALGPLIGGLIINYFSWRWAFLVNVPVSASMVLLTLWKVSESKDPEAKSVDWGGCLSFTLAVGLFIFALINGNERGWSSLIVLGSFVGSAALLAAFVWMELRRAHPMFDLTLFRNRTFVGASLATIFLVTSFWGVFLYTPLYFQSVLGFTPLAAGLAVLPFAVPLSVMAPLGGWLSSRISPRVLLALGLLLVAAGFLWLWLAVDEPGAGIFAFLGGGIVSGTGCGLINGQISNVAISVVPSERSGMASGINSTMRQVGVALGFAGFGAIFFVRAAHRLAETTAALPSLTLDNNQLAGVIAAGDLAKAIESVPPEFRAQMTLAASESFFAGFHFILIVAALVAALGATLTFLFIKNDEKASEPTPKVNGVDEQM